MKIITKYTMLPYILPILLFSGCNKITKHIMPKPEPQANTKYIPIQSVFNDHTSGTNQDSNYFATANVRADLFLVKERLLQIQKVDPSQKLNQKQKIESQQEIEDQLQQVEELKNRVYLINHNLQNDTSQTTEGSRNSEQLQHDDCSSITLVSNINPKVSIQSITKRVEKLELMYNYEIANLL